MEKTIIIGDKNVPFKITGSFPIRYKGESGRDLFADMAVMSQIANGEFDSLDTSVLYDIAYAAAKTADPSIPPLLDWLDSFEAFPIVSVFVELQPLLTANMHAPKAKNSKAGETR